MPQGELACVRVEVEEVAVASPIEQGPLGAGGWLWLTCAGSMALPARTFRVLTPASRRAAKSTDDMSTGSPAGAAQPRRTARSGRDLALVTRVNGPHKIGDRRSPDTNDHAELPIVVPQEAYRPAHKHGLIRRALFGRIVCIGVVAALTCARWRRRSARGQWQVYLRYLQVDGGR